MVPIALRPYVTGFVCACWGLGQLIASGVLRAVLEINGEMGWRLPFILQFLWPTPLAIGIYFAPESPWNAIRREKPELARASLTSLRQDSPSRAAEVEASLALIRHTTAIERAETAGATFLQCFQGINLRRTEIVSGLMTMANARTASFGRLKSSVVMVSSVSLSSSCNALVSPRCKASTSTSRSLRATSSDG